MKIAAFLLVVLLAYTLQGITGVGGPLMAMPFSILLLGISQAKGIITVLSLVTAAAIAIPNRKAINWKEVLKILALMAVGLALGLWLYEIAPKAVLLRIYGVTVLIVAIRNLFFNKPLRAPEWVMWLILILAGVMQGLFVSGGAFFIIYASGIFKDKTEFRASSSVVWSVTNLCMVPANIRAGLLTTADLPLLAGSVAAALLATWLGGRLQKPMSMAVFTKLIYCVLLLAGVILLYNSL